MRTEYHKIDDRCIKCGNKAEYVLYRNGFLYRYDCFICWECLKEHLSKLKVFLKRDLKKDEKRN